MAYVRCGGGGSGELHGATITITCEDGIGQTCTLTLGTETVDSKVISSGGSVYFEDIIEIGTYTAKVTIDGTEYTADILITAENVILKENVSAEITTVVFLYKNGNEYTDVTGGYSAFTTKTTVTKTTDYIQVANNTSYNSVIDVAFGNTDVINTIKAHKYLKIKGTEDLRNFYHVSAIPCTMKFEIKYNSNLFKDYTFTPNLTEIGEFELTLDTNQITVPSNINNIWIKVTTDDTLSTSSYYRIEKLYLED